MLRLWNLLDARCLFKRKVGLSRDEPSEDEEEEEEEGVEKKKKTAEEEKADEEEVTAKLHL